MKKFDAALFDFDGTLVNTGRGITGSIDKALEAFGITENDKSSLNRFIGPPLDDSFMRFYGADEKTAAAMVEKYREFYRAGGIYQSELYPGTREMLEALAQNAVKCAIASSKPVVFVTQLLDWFGLTGCFEVVSAPPLDHVYPPKSQLITTALNTMGVPPSRAVMVGDRHYDIDGAKAAGTASIGAGFGFAAEGELQRAGADFIAASPSDIAEHITADINREKDCVK